MYRGVIFVAALVVASAAQGWAVLKSISGTTPSASTRDGSPAMPSSYSMEVRGDLVTSASGEATFGTIATANHSPATMVVSLGACSQQSAILFTRNAGSSITPGRYRVSEYPSGTDEVSALILTGSPTRPTGVFRGRTGWLTVTSVSDRVLAGRFELAGVGFRAQEPENETRIVSVSGSFSANPSNGSSLEACQDVTGR